VRRCRGRLGPRAMKHATLRDAPDRPRPGTYRRGGPLRSRPGGSSTRRHDDHRLQRVWGASGHTNTLKRWPNGTTDVDVVVVREGKKRQGTGARVCARDRRQAGPRQGTGQDCQGHRGPERRRESGGRHAVVSWDVGTSNARPSDTVVWLCAGTSVVSPRRGSAPTSPGPPARGSGGGPGRPRAGAVPLRLLAQGPPPSASPPQH